MKLCTPSYQNNILHILDTLSHGNIAATAVSSGLDNARYSLKSSIHHVKATNVLVGRLNKGQNCFYLYAQIELIDWHNDKGREGGTIYIFFYLNTKCTC